MALLDKLGDGVKEAVKQELVVKDSVPHVLEVYVTERVIDALDVVLLLSVTLAV